MGKYEKFRQKLLDGGSDNSNAILRYKLKENDTNWILDKFEAAKGLTAY
jgi:hypothetical protein